MTKVSFYPNLSHSITVPNGLSLGMNQQIINTMFINKDQAIRQNILNELENETQLKDHQSLITVYVQNGIATLEGFADSYTAKVLACTTASHVSGVVEVQEHINVEYPDKRLQVEIDWTSGKMAVNS